MLKTTTQSDPDPDQEYRAIEAAMLQNSRGRWFLAEHGRRARRLDSLLLEDAISRLQSSLRQPPALLGQLEAEIDGLTTVLKEARHALLQKAASPSPLQGSPTAPSAIDVILRAAEDMHEAAWSLQARDVDPGRCEQIARNAAQIYALAQQQAVVSERTLRLAEAIDQALERIAAMRQTIEHEQKVDEGGAAAILPAVGAPG